ncbi:MAG: hypothetical protein ACK481_00775 [Candidatus Melainabacteria bacterium]|jgi:hypothetical protein
MVEPSILLMQTMYSANIFVAGIVGILCLFFSESIGTQVFAGKALDSIPLKILGSFWLSVALVSIIGLFFPKAMSVLFIIQFLYKGMWLLVGALPKILNKQFDLLPLGMTICFFIWVLLLPFVIPYKFLFGI